jgi:hypothetical protein
MILKRQLIIIAVLVVVVLIAVAFAHVAFSTVFTIASALVGACVLLFLYRRLMPVLSLNIEPCWANGSDGLVILRVTLQNTGRVAARRKEAWIQVLEHIPPKDGDLYSDWVPLSEDTKRSGEEPLTWKSKRPILSTTVKIEAGESIRVDFLYHCPSHSVTHILVQFQAQLDTITRRLYDSPSDSWTTTAWLARPDGKLKS